MKRALREYHIEGIKSNISFFQEILENPNFKKGEFDTGFIDRWLQTRTGDDPLPAIDRDFAVLAAALFHSGRTVTPPESAASTESAWKLEGRRRGMRRR
jgi:acetyl-CoA carboxylase biotin carboxylase subunit